MSDEIYEHLLYDGAKHKSVASFSPGALRPHDHRPWIRQSLEHDRLAAGFPAAPEPIAKAIDAIQSHSTSNPTSFAQKGAVAALTGPQDHLPKLARGIRQAPHLRLQEAQQHSGHLVRERERRVLPLPEHFANSGLKSTEFCARLLEAGKSRRRARHRVRRGRLHAHQLRDEHGEY